MDFPSPFRLVFELAFVLLTIPYISAQSRNCIDDLDLEDVQEYSYNIPHSEEVDYWKNNQLNYYTFGKFDSSNTDKETTITAGIYKGDELIYKTEINCDSGMWKNTVLNIYGKEKTILSGNIDRSLTTCQAGETFDLILKVNNWYAMNWIFNAQALQHDTRSAYYKFVYAGRRTRRNRDRPAVRAFSKYRSYQATRFVLTATGRAKIDRFVFGQCDAWPKGLAKFDNYCQRVYYWTYARSKANSTERAREKILGMPFTKDLPKGLGVFGNNRVIHIPLCFTVKYFYFMMLYVHPDNKLPFRLKNTFNENFENNKLRAYCCNIDIFTGQILKNDPDKYCYPLGSCRFNLLDEASLKIISDTDPGSMVRKQLDEVRLLNPGQDPSRDEELIDETGMDLNQFIQMGGYTSNR